MRQRGTLPSCSAPSSSRGFAPAAPAVSSALSSPCSGADYYAVPAGEASVASPSEPRKRPREDDELDASPATSTSACSPLRPRSLPQAKSKPTAAKLGQVAEGSPAARKLKMKPPPVPCFKPEPEPWLVLREMQLPPKKAEENYEISDKGSDSEAEDERGHKLVPEWSLKYLELLQAQSDIDADTIFGTRVPTCDLEEVFKDSDYMKFQAERPPRRRGSSGEWRHDRLSREEISAYKRKTGQLKRKKTMRACGFESDQVQIQSCDPLQASEDLLQTEALRGCIWAISRQNLRKGMWQASDSGCAFHGIRATGWAEQARKEESMPSCEDLDENLVAVSDDGVFHYLYSDHCSFLELVQFLQFLPKAPVTFISPVGSSEGTYSFDGADGIQKLMASASVPSIRYSERPTRCFEKTSLPRAKRKAEGPHEEDGYEQKKSAGA
eukprot:g25884.t1